ncbi:hypothetical protein [Agromyces flavus]
MVDIWNEEHPEIQVTVNKQDGGDPRSPSCSRPSRPAAVRPT